MPIRLMSLSDYDAVLALWQASPGVGLSDADSPQAIARFLERNPGLLRIKSVRHNLSGPKLRWLEFLEARLQEDLNV